MANENSVALLPEFVQHPTLGLHKISGWSTNSGPDVEIPCYKGVDVLGNTNFNLFKQTVKPVSREQVVAFLGEPKAEKKEMTGEEKAREIVELVSKHFSFPTISANGNVYSVGTEVRGELRSYLFDAIEEIKRAAGCKVSMARSKHGFRITFSGNSRLEG